MATNPRGCAGAAADKGSSPRRDGCGGRLQGPNGSPCDANPLGTRSFAWTAIEAVLAVTGYWPYIRRRSNPWQPRLPNPTGLDAPAQSVSRPGSLRSKRGLLSVPQRYKVER